METIDGRDLTNDVEWHLDIFSAGLRLSAAQKTVSHKGHLVIIDNRRQFWRTVTMADNTFYAINKRYTTSTGEKNMILSGNTDYCARFLLWNIIICNNTTPHTFRQYLSGGLDIIYFHFFFFITNILNIIVSMIILISYSYMLWSKSVKIV